MKNDIYTTALLCVSLPRFQVGIRLPISSTKRRGCRLSPQRNFSPAPLGNPVLRTLGVGGSEAPLRRSAPGAPPARRGSPFLPRNGEKEGRGPLSSVGSSVGTIAGWTLQRGFPADSGGGARLSLEKVGGKNTRGKPLDPIFYSRSFPLAGFWVNCL